MGKGEVQCEDIALNIGLLSFFGDDEVYIFAGGGIPLHWLVLGFKLLLYYQKFILFF